MPTISKSSVDASLGIKGLIQLRVLRSMLHLGSFTRKELAEHSGQDIEAVNAVVGRHKDWFEEKATVRSGRPGAREQRLVLRAEQEKELVSVLDPLYETVEASVPGAEGQASAYLPSSIEFQAAADLIALSSERGESKPAEVRRSLRLLETASEKEGLPLTESIEGYLGQSDALWTNTQKAAKTHMDGLRARLCLLSVPQLFAGSARTTLGFDNPAILGLKFLEQAVLNFTALGAGRAVLDLDSWAEAHAAPMMARVLSSGDFADQAWYESFQMTLASPVLTNFVPRFAEPFAPRRFEIVDPSRIAEVEGKKRIVCTYLEMNILGKRPEVRYATQRLVGRPNVGQGIRVVMDNAKALQGLVSVYCKTYAPSSDRVAALLNVRHQAVQMAIVKGESLRFSRTITPPSAWKHGHAQFGYLRNRMPFFAAGGRNIAEEKDFLVTEIRKSLEFYKANESVEQIDIVYLAGEPKVSEGIEQILRSALGLTVKPFDFSKCRIQVAGFSPFQNEERARRLAPEIGLAWQQCETLRAKSVASPCQEEEWDALF
jgi:hypothetical protein